MISLGTTNGRALAIDVDLLIENRLIVQGASNSGKSYAVRRILEQTHGRAQQIVLDVEDEYASLRERFEYALGGPGRDFPVEARSAELLARRLLELGVSAILNLYELKSHDRIRFVRGFLDAMMSAPKPLWHDTIVVVEEASTLAPQSGRDAESTQSVIDLATRGRKRGFAIVPVCQRISDLHKSVVAQCGNRLIGRTTLDADVKRAAYELGFSGRDAVRALVELPRGSFFACGPALSDEVVRVEVGKCTTTHGTKRGARATAPPPAPEKVRALLAQLADLPKEAEAEARSADEWRTKCRQLERDMAAAVKAQVLPDPAALERARNDGFAAGSEVTRRAFAPLVESTNRTLDQIAKAIEAAHDALPELLKVPAIEVPQEGAMPGAAGSRGSAAAFRAPRTSRFPSSNEVAKRTEPSAEGIDGPMQKILDGAAELEALGIAPAWREQLAFICGYTNPRSGGFSEPLGRLIARELMAAAGAGQVQLTHNGRAAAWLPERPSTSAELQARILAALDGPEAKILGALIGLYPEDITRDHLGSGCGYKNPRSGGFSEPLGKLIRLGLVEVPHRGRVRAARLLSLEGGH